MTAPRKQPDIVKTSWRSLKKEWLTDELSRQVIHGKKATLEYGLDDRTVVVRAGEIVVVPSSVPHAIVAPENSICVFFFAPVRQDWLKGEDQYLRNPH